VTSIAAIFFTICGDSKPKSIDLISCIRITTLCFEFILTVPEFYSRIYFHFNFYFSISPFWFSRNFIFAAIFEV